MLYIACSLGRTEIVKILLFGMANPDLGMPTYGDTPLMITSQKGDLEIAKLLIYHKCNIFETNKNGMNALHFACLSKEKKYCDMVKLIYYSAIESRKIDKTCKCLSDKDFDNKIKQFVNQKALRNGQTVTPYMMAQKVGNQQIVQFLANIDHH